MKKVLAFAMMLGCSAGLFAAAQTAAPTPTPAAKPAAPAAKVCKTAAPATVGCKGAVDKTNIPEPLDQWTIFQLVFFPNVPNSTWNTNVFGLKTGWVASGGIGTVCGAEISWCYAGTDNIHGAQGGWVVAKSKNLNGIQATLATTLNTGTLNGLQATGAYALAGDVMGAQFSATSQAGNFMGIQGGVLLALAKEFTGFQAAGVSIARGPFTGIQCGLFTKSGKDGGSLQLGLFNVSEGKGMQFGLINCNKNGFLPVFPILNFNF